MRRGSDGIRHEQESGAGFAHPTATGVGTLTGTMIGVYIMSVLKNGLISMSLPAPYQTFFTGLVVIGAVLMDVYRNKKANELKKIRK